MQMENEIDTYISAFAAFIVTAWREKSIEKASIKKVPWRRKYLKQSTFFGGHLSEFQLAFV